MLATPSAASSKKPRTRIVHLNLSDDVAEYFSHEGGLYTLCVPNADDELSEDDGKHCTSDGTTKRNEGEGKGTTPLEPVSDYCHDRSEDHARAQLRSRG